jgi:hypothetical protein
MASFTDVLPQFAPYVSQIPNELMLKVGMDKQQKYEQGIQRIQSNIDNVAGLDIANPVQQKYLESKLNQLGNDLKWVGAGDFSDFQLVNSVNGMTNQIVKDKTVVNAVSSTARVRKEQSNLEAAKKAGKSSVQNEDYLNYQISGYLNNEDVNASFSGKYINYIDIDKKLREVADKIHEVDNSIENPYKRDNAGNTLYFDSKGNASTDPSKGVARIDDAILSIKVKGKPAEKILSNFYDSLNENDKQQLHIDSWHHYRGATADTFKEDITKNYKNQKQILSDKIIQLNLELTTNPKLSTAEKNKIEADIHDTNNMLSNGSLEKSLTKQIEEIDSNPDIEEYKYKIYTQKTLTNLAKDVSWQSYEQEYKSNPYAQMDMEKRRLQAEYDKMRQSESHFQQNLSWDKTKFRIDQQQKAAAALGTLPPVTDAAIPTNVDTPDLDKLNQEILTLAGERTKGGAILQVGDIDRLTNKYVNSVTNPSLNTNQKKVTYLDYLAREYAKDPNKLISALRNPNLAEYLEQRRALEIKIGQKQALALATKKASSGYDEKQKTILNQEPGVNFTNGKPMYSANEIFNFSETAEKFYKTTAGGVSPTTGVSTSKTKLDVNSLLSAFKGRKEEALAQAYAKHYLGQSLTPTEQILFKKTQDIKIKYDSKIKKLNQEKLKFESDYLAAKMPERQMQVGTLDYENNKADQTAINSAIGNKLREFNTLGQVDVQKWGDFNTSTLETIRKNPKALYTIEKRYDGTANLIATDGKNTQTIPLTSGELKVMFPRIAQSNPWNDIKYDVLASPNYTTNLKGGNDSSTATNAKLSGYDVAHLANTAIAPLVRFDVEGSANNSGKDNDRFILRMYVNNNGQWITDYATSKFVSLADVQEQANSITPATVANFLKTHK